jgi:hypothetical protein
MFIAPLPPDGARNVELKKGLNVASAAKLQ